jgi:3'-5' exoribonuclease
VPDVAKLFVADIQADQEVTSTFIVADKQMRLARSGKPFLTLKLVDKSGEITGRIWERAAEINTAIPAKGVVAVRARSEKFREELQLHIQEIVAVPLDQVDAADFLPVCPLDLQELWSKCKQLTGQLKRRSLQRLMAAIMRDAELVERFKRAPAAKSMHHAYLGGLLEHTVGVAGLVLRISEHYPELDRDLLLAGAIFHDLGKVREFVYDLVIDYSHEGRLLGHMVQGVEIVEEKLRSIKAFPAEEALLLKHLILSHHGVAEFGAVKLPMTREAVALHFADDLDAKMNTLTRILGESRPEDEAWTAYQPLFARFFFRGLPAASGGTVPEEDAAREHAATGVQLRVFPPAGPRGEGKT